jgi:hypothetical protein
MQIRLRCRELNEIAPESTHGTDIIARRHQNGRVLARGLRTSGRYDRYAGIDDAEFLVFEPEKDQVAAIFTNLYRRVGNISRKN